MRSETNQASAVGHFSADVRLQGQAAAGSMPLDVIVNLENEFCVFSDLQATNIMKRCTQHASSTTNRPGNIRELLIQS